VRRPLVNELLYAMTEPTQETVEVQDGSGKNVELTGKLTEHSGTNSQNPEELNLSN
jgi:hypothetical protein